MSLSINFANKKRLCCDGLESVKQYSHGIETRVGILTENAIASSTPLSSTLVDDVEDLIAQAASLLKDAQTLLD